MTLNRRSFAQFCGLAGASLCASSRAFAATGETLYADDFFREVTVDRSRDQAVEALEGLGLSRDELLLMGRRSRQLGQTRFDLQPRQVTRHVPGQVALSTPAPRAMAMITPSTTR